jgi:hypothetical protein
MNKHTKGPWSVGGPTGCLNQIGIDPAIGCAYGAGEEVKANARLIAAAPDLLEALQALMPGAEAMGWDVSKARAAITKATGEQS